MKLEMPVIAREKIQGLNERSHDSPIRPAGRIMDRHTQKETTAPIHCAAAKTAVAEFNCSRNHESVVNNGLPVGR
jgi:hypothetical protein